MNRQARRADTPKGRQILIGPQIQVASALRACGDLKSIATEAFDPGRGCASPPGLKPKPLGLPQVFGSSSSLWEFPKPLDFLKPEGLAYPLPVVVTTGCRPL